MKQLTLGFTMLAIGLALGLAVPPLLAQSNAPPKVQKWEQYCDKFKDVRVSKINAKLKDAGDQGFELVGSENATFFCFRRPVP